MTLSAAEQYLLELINRARLDPAAEAARQGIDLNAGLGAGTLSTAAKQVLAPNALLEAAATKHSLWIGSTGTFSHTGENGSWPSDRIAAEGYSYSTWSENICMRWSSGSLTIESSINALHDTLFQSAGHRVNLLNDAFREVGLGAELGIYKVNGKNMSAAYLTEVFATSGTAHFLTGVAYQDGNGDLFYGMGEGTSNVTFAVEGQQTATASAGGYALALGSGAAVAVTGQAGSLSFSLTVDMRPGNVKLDLVSGKTFLTSGSVILGLGINDVGLLGVADLQATGNGAGNALTGNSAANRLAGLAGDDNLSGGAGADRLIGGTGADRLTGGSGSDLLRGGAGADVFVFGPGGGADRMMDFRATDLDILRLDNALWGGATLGADEILARYGTQTAQALTLDFGADVLRLVDVTSADALASLIEIF